MKRINKKIIHYDPLSDVLYMGVKKGVEDQYVEVSPGVNVELDAKGQVIGIEMLNASRILPFFQQKIPKAKVFRQRTASAMS